MAATTLPALILGGEVARTRTPRSRAGRKALALPDRAGPGDRPLAALPARRRRRRGRRRGGGPAVTRPSNVPACPPGSAGRRAVRAWSSRRRRPGWGYCGAADPRAEAGGERHVRHRRGRGASCCRCPAAARSTCDGETFELDRAAQRVLPGHRLRLRAPRRRRSPCRVRGRRPVRAARRPRDAAAAAPLRRRPRTCRSSCAAPGQASRQVNNFCTPGHVRGRPADRRRGAHARRRTGRPTRRTSTTRTASGESRARGDLLLRGRRRPDGARLGYQRVYGTRARPRDRRAAPRCAAATPCSSRTAGTARRWPRPATTSTTSTSWPGPGTSGPG